MVARGWSCRTPVRLMTGLLMMGSLDGGAFAKPSEDTRIAATCERTREVLKLPDGMTIADLRSGVDVPLETVRVCVEKPRSCSVEDERLALCIAS